MSGRGRRVLYVHRGWFQPSVISDRWRLFFTAIRERCGFEIRFIEVSQAVSADVDVAFFACGSRRLNDPQVRQLISTCRARRVFLVGDYVPGRDAGADESLAAADLILAPEYETYNAAFRGVRVEFFPYFFAPDERYAALRWNEHPIERCLISGPVNAFYPLRQAAVKSSQVDVLAHPGSHGAMSVGAVVRDEYARRLNAYRAAVSGSLRNGITTKTFEIMAAGALLVTDTISDMARLGMVPWVHYAEVTTLDVLDKIAAILDDPPKYDIVRREGMEYARAHHGLKNRVAQFASLVETL